MCVCACFVFLVCVCERESFYVFVFVRACVFACVLACSCSLLPAYHRGELLLPRQRRRLLPDDFLWLSCDGG